MIILDTGVLRGLGLKSSFAELLRAIKESGVEKVAVPWMVLEELAAQQALKYLEAHTRAREAMEQLAKATPWPTARTAPKVDADAVREHWRREYRSLVEVIEPNPQVLSEGLYREANLLAPAHVVTAKTRPVKIGARDSVIWLSAIEYARSHAEETVYFVSGNTRDFGDAESRPPLLDEDLSGVDDRFIHLTSIDDVIQRFAMPVKPDMDWYESALRQAAVVAALKLAAKDLLARESDELLLPSPRRRPYTGRAWEDPWAGLQLADEAPESSEQTVEWMEWADTPQIEAFSISDAKSYEIGGQIGHIWSTANVRLLLHGTAFDHFYDTQQISCLWDTRIMFSYDESPVVLSHSRPRAYTDEERLATTDLYPEFPF
ncbi:PIN domain-containing protein [Streptomyces longisporoflavus]|uniref:PIN domain-containing protein n=1 Tax=Streptomyces longisporoflavus TaxID=28044 RepID=A0ABW7R3C4_9ACTN